MTSKSTPHSKNIVRTISVDKRCKASQYFESSHFDAWNRQTAMPRQGHAAGATRVPEDRVDCVQYIPVYSLKFEILKSESSNHGQRPRTCSPTEAEAGILLMLFQAVCKIGTTKSPRPTAEKRKRIKLAYICLNRASTAKKWLNSINGNGKPMFSLPEVPQFNALPTAEVEHKACPCVPRASVRPHYQLFLGYHLGVWWSIWFKVHMGSMRASP